MPEYRCDCETCQDARTVGSRNYRTRPSIHVEKDSKHVQFDVGPNFIDQIDRNRVEWIDAVVYTHCHADHIAGTNDLVMPCRKQQMDMPIYGPEDTMGILQRNFDYMFTKETFQGGGVAHLLSHVVTEQFELCGLELTPLPVEHGAVQTIGYRIDDFGYVPDVKTLPDASRELLRGVEVLVIDALSFNPRHPTHLSVGEAVAIVNDLYPREAYFTHIMHRLDHRSFREQCAAQNIELPPSTYLAYDGQVIEL
ncbi:MAG: MBL fold metallo-hydrolase [Candidatus Latescibacteria bacterium]|nr:MBL fold metallo-hydrolase [Candidatus Latescibacterota bacterium]